MPLVSVIIPVFNRSTLILRAVKSVLHQSFSNFELIVVDDGSEDNITKSLSPFKEIKLIRFNENKGVSKARNEGVKQSVGDWVAFLDSDDEWLPAKLEEQIHWVTQNPQFNILQSEEIWIRKGRRVNPPLTHIKTEGDLFFKNLRRCCITPSSVLMKRKLFYIYGGFDESFPVCEDYDLWLRMTLYEKVGLVPSEHLIRYGGHPDQLSSSMPCFDKYRIRSLQKLLSIEDLGDEKKSAIIETIRKKAAIVANGALKRGFMDEYSKYFALSK